MKKFIFLILPVFLGSLFSPLILYAETTPPLSSAQYQTPVQALLISEKNSVEPGKPFWIGVELKMAQGWDTYWINPGDSGFATQIEWTLPKGFKAGPIQWPVPQKFTNENMVGFGYTDTVLLMSQITPPTDLTDSEIEIQAEVSWLACNQSCEPGNAKLSLALPISASSAVDSGQANLFAKAKQSLPQVSDIKVDAKQDTIVLQFQPVGKQVAAVQFFPEQAEVIDYSAPQTLDVSKGGWELNLKRSPMSAALPDHLKGVLTFSDETTGMQHVLKVDSQFKQAASSIATELSGFWVALGLALLGGLILNVMPCVMPVIALKIFSFVKMAQEKRRVIFQHGLSFTFGVLVSFWLLSGILLLLRFYGQSLGWGFQLQEPVFVVVLASILFLLGLSLFGVFELGTSLIAVAQKGNKTSSPLLSSFLSGVLATLVATPCTGPLLGPALGFAMTLPPLKALLIFTAMGLGMSSPYLVFAAFPKLVRFLPKPGNWMVIFKQAMGFLMMATVAWLVWVFGAQTSNLATFLLLLSLLIMAIGTWIYGRFSAPIHKKAVRTLATCVALLMISLGSVQAISAAKKYSNEPTEVIAHQAGWETFSMEKVAQLQAQGTPVFVDFTAKWCLICQANKVVLHSSEVTKLFKQHGVVAMVADWTKKDPAITQQLESLGRTGVPVYALYPPQEGAKPYLLPQTLSGNILNEFLSKVDAN